MHWLSLHKNMLRIVGLSTLLIASLPTAWDVCNRPPQTSALKFGFWVVSCFVFGVSFWLTFVSNRDFQKDVTGASKPQTALIAIQSAATLLMVYLVPCYSIGILLVLVAWQVAVAFRQPIALIWIVAQTLALAGILYGRSSELTLFATNTSLAFQLFAFITASVAQSEAHARIELTQANSELQETRGLLAETTRINERSRISGELHDVLGHNLTALNIHLEVAKHTTQGKALEHVEKSQALAKLLLKDVRQVVSMSDDDDHHELRPAVESLVEGLPFPRIHLELADDLRVEDSARSQTLVRCIQEIITNTLKHSGAENLWLEVYEANGGVEVRARDDGRGAELVDGGNGILGMRRRLEKFGGHLRIETSHQRGFEVSAWMPLNGAVQ